MAKGQSSTMEDTALTIQHLRRGAFRHSMQHKRPGNKDMPLQNRVNPEGVICHSSARGTLMGNRGCLHDDKQNITSNSKRDAWVTCLLEFKGRKRPLMKPGQYTELFFLDEATALAAGHRPCAECRRERYKAFLAAWPETGAKAGDVDVTLKRERVKGSRKVMSADQLSTLPDGVLVKHMGSGHFYLLHGGEAYPWSFSGYGAKERPQSLSGNFQLLTPASTVAALKNGYRPDFNHQWLSDSSGSVEGLRRKTSPEPALTLRTVSSTKPNGGYARRFK